MNTSNTAGFKVIKPGFLSLLQDQGRFGQHAIGLTTGGPLDKFSFDWANRLCNNPVNACAIESSIGGLCLEAQANVQIAVTGGDATVMINRQAVKSWRTHLIEAGDILEMGYARNTTRHYIAVSGGFLISPMFESCSTVTREKIGGLNGDALKKGDFLPYSTQYDSEVSQWSLPEVNRPDYIGEVSLRVILGYQQHDFSKSVQQLFFNTEFTIDKRSDRMGFRLSGPKIQANIDGILSEGICYGAIQVPPDGQPIILLNDRQTIGGYPKIGSILSLDIPKLTQRLPGTKIRFEAITIDEAQRLLQLAHKNYQATRAMRIVRV